MSSVVCDGNVSGTAVRAVVKRTPEAASADSAGAMAGVSRSARIVSIVMITTERGGPAGAGAEPVAADPGALDDSPQPARFDVATTSPARATARMPRTPAIMMRRRGMCPVVLTRRGRG